MPLPLLALVAAAVALLAAACVAPADDSPPTGTPPLVATPTPSPLLDLVRNAQDAQRGGILTLANRDDPPTGFDPMRTSSIALHHVGGALFGPGNLVMRCRENMYLICPLLARRWVANEDFTQWTFTIQDRVTWHDGAPFTAQDVKFWYEMAAYGAAVGDRTRAPAYFTTELGEAPTVEVLPGNLVRITLQQPSPMFLDVLMNPRYKIAHPAHLMGPRLEAGDMSVAPADVGLVGAGPFRLERYDPGTLVQVRRYERYWERDGMGNALPYLDGINYVIMPNPEAMDAAFRVGRLDGGARGEGHYLTVERMAGYHKDLPGKVYFAQMQGGIFRLAFNVLNEGPWQDVRVRRAIALWIDKEASIPSVLGGFGYISPVLGPANPFTSANFVNWPGFNRASLEANRAEALRLMADAGYASGFTMGYLCRDITLPRCEFLHAQLAGLGVNLQLNVVDEALWNLGRISLSYDAQSGPNTTPPVPEGTEISLGRYGKNPDALAKHEDPQVDRLYQALYNARTYDQRLAAWRAIEEYVILQHAYIVPIAGTLQLVPYRIYVKGLVIPPEDGHTHTDFATVWLDK
ncbi:MAG: ABC transporter substrate-binding protein [Chloroflexi bacterium]|nr:ABC transporter substrate-binding protein [Chloroflexota bacterium]